MVKGEHQGSETQLRTIKGRADNETQVIDMRDTDTLA